VFVNNRRLAERLALRLNELAEERSRAPTTARSRASSACSSRRT
jgi:Lhr-like helicase